MKWRDERGLIKSEMKRWKMRWRGSNQKWDEEMKGEMKGSEFVSSQIWCYLIFLGGGGWEVRGGGSIQKSKLLRMAWKHFGFGIFEIQWNFWYWKKFVSGHKQAYKQPSKQLYRHHSHPISRSTLTDGATEKPTVLDGKFSLKNPLIYCFFLHVVAVMNAAEWTQAFD